MFVSIVGLSVSELMNSNVFMHAVVLGNPVLFLTGSVCGTCLIPQIASYVNNRLFDNIGRDLIVTIDIHQDII